MKNLIKILKIRDEVGLVHRVKRILASDIDYAHEVDLILTSPLPKNKKQEQLKELVDSYHTQTLVKCPLMELILKQGKVTIENVKKVIEVWKRTEQQPC